MPLYTWQTHEYGPGTNFVFRSNPASALDRFAAASIMNNRRKRRPWRRIRTPGVDNVAGSMIIQSHFGKGLTIEGSAERFHEVSKAEEKRKKQKGEMSAAERNIALATNTAGVIAAPAALYAAGKAARANEGGMPRMLARKVSESKRVPAGSRKKLKRAVKRLDKPLTPAQRKLAAATGVTMVGLQAANAVGDSIAARAMANAKED